MSSPTSRRRTWIRIRRFTSLALGIIASALAAGLAVIFVVRPSTYLGDGEFGISPVPAFIVTSFPCTVVLTIAALILAGTLPAPEPPPAPRIDALPTRLPMTIALIAAGLIGACIAVPIVAIAFSLIVGVLQVAV